jgi:hypothetical protein
MVASTSAGVRRRWLAVLVSAALLSATPPLASQTGADALARKHFESGVAYLEESDYPNAIKAFQKSFELSKRPEILLNIATAHERSGDLPSAVAALKRYLEIAPNGAHAESVALRLANLEKRIAETPVTDAGTPAEQTDAGLPPDTTGSAVPITTLPPPPPGGDTPEQEPNRLPAYIAFGVGGLAAAGAVLTGVLARPSTTTQAGCAPSARTTMSPVRARRDQHDPHRCRRGRREHRSRALVHRRARRTVRAGWDVRAERRMARAQRRSEILMRRSSPSPAPVPCVASAAAGCAFLLDSTSSRREKMPAAARRASARRAATTRTRARRIAATRARARPNACTIRRTWSRRASLSPRA